MCPQMSCTSCLSNDIQTPDQISVPCTTPYFHKDTLTPPSSSRSPPLEGGGPSTYEVRDASLYNARPLFRDLLEGIQLMSIAAYEAFVCVCFFVYKTCTAFIWLLWDARSHLYVFITKTYRNKKEKHIFFNEQKVGMLLQKITDTRGVGISNMRKSIYLLTTTPTSHTHRFHPLPLATPTSCSPHPLATPIHSTHSPQLSSIL